MPMPNSTPYQNNKKAKIVQILNTFKNQILEYICTPGLEIRMHIQKLKTSFFFGNVEVFFGKVTSIRAVTEKNAVCFPLRYWSMGIWVEEKKNSLDFWEMIINPQVLSLGCSGIRLESEVLTAAVFMPQK